MHLRYASTRSEMYRVYNLPVMKMENVLFAADGHAVKTDGSLWDIYCGFMVLPPGSVWTGTLYQTKEKPHGNKIYN